MDNAFQAIVAAIGSFFIVSLLLVGAIMLCQQYRNSSKARTRHRSTTPAPTRDASFSLAVVDASWSSDPNLIKITWEELAVATENFSPHLIVGDGSFGLVYKARLSTNALVAVKKLSPDAFQGFREFRAEMETLSKLNHPNIVRILGYWASGPERLLVYEFIEKGNLDQWLHEPDPSRTPLSWETRVNIIRGVAHGLSYLHGLEKPVIHRDIKASNILLDSKFHAHIADFGLARRIDKTHSHVSTQFAGTMGYMPPEYIEGSNVANTKVDVYSFGILMIETMSSHRPNLPMKLGENDIGIVQWAKKMREQNAEMDMVDVNISREGLSEESVREYVRIACECTSAMQKERPEMPQVLPHTLSLVKAVLLDAEQKQEHNHELREWLRQLKRVFSDAQDLLDEFECQTLQNQVVKAHGTTKTKVGRFFSSSNPLVFRYKMAQQIKDITNRLDKVAADRRKFGLQTIDVDTRVVHRIEMTHSHVNDSDVIGREHDKGKIIHILMQKNGIDIDKSLSVIPIVGMGGLGKTTLAKFVFNDDRINECFPLKMWVCVSENFDIKQMIVKIINSANDSASHAHAPDFQQNLNILDMEQLQNQLRNKLAGKKFLLILDDVWNEDRVKWVELRNLIQVGAAAGSKILVTTRSHSIASLMGTVSSHILQGLSLEDSTSLFVKWAFKEAEEENYPHLINIGRDIVKKCRGVPLAVRTIGSLLFSKFEANEWEYVRDSEIWNLPQKKEDILPTLKLSYDLMPSYLRQCFALFSLYPKDYEFVNFEVTTLWGALGLLGSLKKNMTQEDVANQYFNELLSRSFIQDFVSCGTAYTFKIHDVVHDLALFVAKDECLLVNSHIRCIPESIRHLSFVENDLDGKSFSAKSVGVRTILFPKDGVGANSEAFFTLVSRYKYLHILDLSYSSVGTLPGFIGKLKHLRYLSLYNNKKIRGLPDSICELQSLQVLDLGGCQELEALPKGLRKLISLRDFVITTKQAVLPENDIANLSCLQYLTIECCDNVESLFSGIELPHLKALNVSSCKRLQYLPLDSKHFPALEILCIRICDKLGLSKGPEDQKFILKLKTILFTSLPQLGTLPHWLQGSISTLLSLRLEHCHNLEVLPDWLPMLTSLKALDITDCPKLRSLPDGINCLTALERLEVIDCPELFRKFTLQVGEHWNQMSHIKRISMFERKDLE